MKDRSEDVWAKWRANISTRAAHLWAVLGAEQRNGITKANEDSGERTKDAMRTVFGRGGRWWCELTTFGCVRIQKRYMSRMSVSGKSHPRKIPMAGSMFAHTLDVGNLSQTSLPALQ